MPFPWEVQVNEDGSVSSSVDNPLAQQAAINQAELAGAGLIDPSIAQAAGVQVGPPNTAGMFPPGLAPPQVGVEGLPDYLTNPSAYATPPGAPRGLLPDGTVPKSGLSLSQATVPEPTLELAEKSHKLKCPKCGTVQSASNKKCTNCGHDLTSARKAKFANMSQDGEHQAVIYNTQGLNLAVEGDDGFMWKVVCKTGTLALSPGPGQTDMEIPLVIDDELFNEMVLSAEEKAFPYITVPETHANGSLENTGYVRAWEVLDKQQLLADQRLPAKHHALVEADPDDTRYLLAGIEFTEPDVKGKAERGTIPDTSIGVKFNFRNKRTGKAYKVAWEHVALTPMPWIDGLPAFGLGQGNGPVDADELTIPFDGVYLPTGNLAIQARVSTGNSDYGYDLENIDPEQIEDEAKRALTVVDPDGKVDLPMGVCIQLYSDYFVINSDYDKIAGIRQSEDDAVALAMDTLRDKYNKERERRATGADKIEAYSPTQLPPWPGDTVDDNDGDEGYGLSIAFNEALHPRNHGKFAKKLKDMVNGDQLDVGESTITKAQDVYHIAHGEKGQEHYVHRTAIPNPEHAVASTVQALNKDVAHEYTDVPKPKVESPARSPEGRLRNVKAMSDQKLQTLAEQMTKHEGDPEGSQHVLDELKRRQGGGSKSKTPRPRPGSRSVIGPNKNTAMGFKDRQANHEAAQEIAKTKRAEQAGKPSAGDARRDAEHAQQYADMKRFSSEGKNGIEAVEVADHIDKMKIGDDFRIEDANGDEDWVVTKTGESSWEADDNSGRPFQAASRDELLVNLGLDPELAKEQLPGEQAVGAPGDGVTKGHYDKLAGVTTISTKLPEGFKLKKADAPDHYDIKKAENVHSVHAPDGTLLGHVGKVDYAGERVMSGNIQVGTSGKGKRYAAFDENGKKISPSVHANTTRTDAVRDLGRHHPKHGRARRNLSQDAPDERRRDLSRREQIASLPADSEQTSQTGDTEHMPRGTRTVEDLLASQQAELEASQERIRALEDQLSLSQGQVSSQGEQLHKEAVAKRVRKLQQAGYTPALCLAVKAIEEADKSYLHLSGREPDEDGFLEGGLNLSISREVQKDGESTLETQRLQTPTEVAEFLLLSIAPDKDSAASMLASLQDGLDDLNLSQHEEVNDEEAKKKAVDQWEREAHPERFDAEGKRL